MSGTTGTDSWPGTIQILHDIDCWLLNGVTVHWYSNDVVRSASSALKDLARNKGSPWVAERIYSLLADVFLDNDDLVAAAGFLQKQRQMYRHLKDVSGELQTTLELADLRRLQGLPEQAIVIIEQRLALARATGNRLMEARLLVERSESNLSLADYDRTTADASTALRLLDAGQAWWLEIRAHSARYWALIHSGRAAAGERELRSVRDIGVRERDLPDQPFELRKLGEALARMGLTGDARVVYRDGIRGVDFDQAPGEYRRLRKNASLSSRVPEPLPRLIRRPAR